MFHEATHRILESAMTAGARAAARRPGGTLGLLALVAALALPSGSRAQAPMVGCGADAACTNTEPQDALSRDPLLLGFKWPTAAREAAEPDVLFSEQWWGALDGQGPEAGGTTFGTGCWSFPPNWREPQMNASPHDVVVLTADEIWLDSSVIAMFDMGITLPQPICTMTGGGPEVLTLLDRHAIRWRPLKERDVVPSASGCEEAGSQPRGFIAGYVAWSLPAAGFPAPTRSDYMQSGTRHFADMAALDFDVADPDGQGGSDLDTSDGLVLVNPDGVPDSGDEILELHVCPDDGLARWYTVQPIVRGSFAYFDGGGVSVLGLPSALVDVTGDAIPDVADLLVDGRHEFSDGCGAGLGLLWQGDIATSASAALGEDLVVPPVCGAPVECSRGLRSGVAPFQPAYEPSAVDLRRVQPLGVRQTGPSLVLGWEESLGGEYMGYIGELDVLMRDRVISMVAINPCSPLTSPQLVLPRPPFDAYFLVTQIVDGRESSYGRDSFGRERPHSEHCP